MSINSQPTAHLAKPVEDVVKKGKDGAPRHLDNVVQRLTAVVADSTVRVKEAREDRLDELIHVAW